MSWVASALGLAGNLVKGLFGLKKEQAEVVKSGVSLITEINSADVKEQEAKASVIRAEADSGFWLAAVWRPILMCVFAGMILARWFGYMPPNMTEAELFEVYDLLKMGIGGYIGGRTIEKIVASMGAGKLLREYVSKKVL